MFTGGTLELSRVELLAAGNAICRNQKNSSETVLLYGRNHVINDISVPKRFRCLNVLRSKGFEVAEDHRGLGEQAEVQALYLEHHGRMPLPISIRADRHIGP